MHPRRRPRPNTPDLANKDQQLSNQQTEIYDDGGGLDPN